MTLKEKFVEADRYSIMKTTLADRCEIVADDYAIEFAEWCCAKTLGTDNFKLNDGELKQFKKEKGYVDKNH